MLQNPEYQLKTERFRLTDSYTTYNSVKAARDFQWQPSLYNRTVGYKVRTFTINEMKDNKMRNSVWDYGIVTVALYRSNSILHH